MALYEKINSDKLINASRCFQMFKLRIRVRLINVLFDKEALSVTKICKALKIRQPDASHHLALLHENNLLIRKKVGRTVYYSVNMIVLEKVTRYTAELSNK